jgi:hypothetical protein
MSGQNDDLLHFVFSTKFPAMLLTRQFPAMLLTRQRMETY